MRTLLPLLVLLALVGAAYHPILDLGFLGLDSYPIVASTALDSLGDVPDLFTERLMGGRFQLGDFYRPVLNVTFAVDHAIWGLDPFGYQLTTLLIFVGCVAALYFLVSRLAGPAAVYAPFVAAAVFLLHPVMYETLPVPSRRAEVLCCLFSLLAVRSQLAPARMALRRLPVLPALFTLLAVGSKETALLVPVLLFVAVLLYSPQGGWKARLIHGVTAAIPPVVVVELMGVARLQVIGSFGGYGTSGLEKLAQMEHFGTSLFFPQEVMLKSGAHWLPLAAVLALGLVAVLRWTGTPQAPAEEHARRGSAAVFAVVWTVLMLLLHAFTGKSFPWYVLFPAAGWGMLAGVIVDGLIASIRLRKETLQRVAAAAALLLFGTFLGWQLRYSPLVHHYPDWEEADRLLDEFLEDTSRRIENAEDGRSIRIMDPPFRIEANPSGVSLKGVGILWDYSVQAWVELKYPDRKIRITGRRMPGSVRAAKDELVLMLPK